MASVPACGSAPEAPIGIQRAVARRSERWTKALQGSCQVVTLAGEPEIGKSRAVGEVASQLPSTGAVVLAGHCDSQLEISYPPLREALRSWVRNADGARPNLGTLAGELTALLPELPELMPQLPSPVTAAPDVRRFRLFEAVASWITDVARQVPVLVVMEISLGDPPHTPYAPPRPHLDPGRPGLVHPHLPQRRGARPRSGPGWTREAPPGRRAESQLPIGADDHLAGQTQAVANALRRDVPHPVSTDETAHLVVPRAQIRHDRGRSPALPDRPAGAAPAPCSGRSTCSCRLSDPKRKVCT